MAEQVVVAPGPRGVAVVLAAGLGTRMRSARSKVLHPALGRPLVRWAVGAAQEAGLGVAVVVHHQEDLVRAALAGDGVAFARQAAPRGTGDAVAAGLTALPGSGVLVVLCGDGPLIRSSTLTELLDRHGPEGVGPAVTVVTASLAAPGAYGRIERGPGGEVRRVVEAAEAPPELVASPEVNTGIYAFDIGWLREHLPGLRPHPPKMELYLTDMVEIAASQGRVAGWRLADDREMRGVNDRRELAEAARILQDRITAAWMERGVSFEDPASVTVEPEVTFGEDVDVERGAVLRGRCAVGAGARIGAQAVLIDAVVAPGAQVLPLSHLEGAQVGPGCAVGPFARLRPGAVLEAGAKVGNFVELKKARIGPGAKVPHLSYVGDADVGAGANVGAGTITCNYDGYAKHRTIIGEGAFIGSNSALVAPVRVGDGAIIGAGSVITRDVPDQALGLGRADQRIIDGGGALSRERARQRSQQRPSAAAAPAPGSGGGRSDG
jgi:bifunctional UDP-N-acetylglucosamine pyrophosphorylase/glucosamine-1-phosphate N-acetyltransferase